MPPEPDLSSFTDEEIDRAVSIESGEVPLDSLSDDELEAQIELFKVLPASDLAGGIKDAAGGAVSKLAPPIGTGEGVEGPLRPFGDVSVDAAELALDAGLTAVMPGAGARLLGRGAAGVGARLGRVAGFGAPAALSSVVIDEAFEDEVSISDALVKGGLAATAGTVLEALPVALPLIGKGRQFFKSKTAEISDQIGKAVRAEEDIIAGLRPTVKELNPFTGRSAAADIRAGLYETDLFEGVSDFKGLQDRLIERVGRSADAGGPRIEGTVGARLGVLAKEVDSLPGSRVRFSEVDSYIESARATKLADGDMASTGTVAAKALDTERALFKKKAAAVRLFPEAGLASDSVEKLDKTLASLKNDVIRMETQLSNAGEKKLSAIKIEGIEARLGEKMRRLDELEREIADPEIPFSLLLRSRRDFDKVAASSFDKTFDALTPTGRANLLMANAVREAEKDIVTRATVGAPELGEAFLATKKEFHILKNLETIISRPAGAAQQKLQARGLQKAGSVLKAARQTLSPLAIDIGRGLSREGTLTRGVKSVSGLNFDRPILNTAPLDAITSAPSIPTIIGVTAAVPGAKYLGLTKDRESLVTSIMGALFSREGVDLGEGVPEEDLPEELTRGARFEATSAVSALEQAERQLGQESMEYAKVLSNFAVEFPEMFGKPKSGIPGEIVIGGRIMLPNENHRISYSNKLKASSKLDKLQKAKMRSAAHRGDVISQSKASKSSTAFRSQAALEEDG